MPASATSSRFRAASLLGAVSFLGKYPGRVALCLSLLLVNISIEMTLPQIIGDMITDLRQATAESLSWSPWLSVRLFVSLVLIRFGVGLILGRARNRTIQATLVDIRAAIYDAMQRLPFTYHDKTGTGELISRATSDVFRLQDFFFACLFLAVDIAVSLIVILVLIFKISPVLGGLTLGTVLPTVTLVAFFAGKLQPRWRQVHDLHGALTTVIQENISGVRVVKAFAREEAEVEKFQHRKDAFLSTLMATVNYWATRVPLAQFLFGLSLPLALWVGGGQVIEGQLRIGDLAKVVFYIMAIGHRMGMVGQFTNIVQNASASAERILEVIRQPRAIRSGPRDLPPGRGSVRFEGVTFHYTDGKASLANVSFEARPGQTIAIVGPTGSGKTTLVNLIPRFYDPAEGRVLVEGTDARDLKLDQLRRAVGIIFQETFLFSASVLENIAYGKPQATRAEVEACARAAQAHEFIAALPEGYDTVIGERGVSLSGGQRQRLAIARGFLMDPRVLILDDATASVDPATERLIEEAMRRLCENRTTFVIAQRFSTVQHADLILVLREGRIVERGQHDELIRREGFYREVFEQQIKR
jgi:ATP-binding cassette, subfamily B, multidrug efflux pump